MNIYTKIVFNPHQTGKFLLMINDFFEKYSIKSVNSRIIFESREKISEDKTRKNRKFYESVRSSEDEDNEYLQVKLKLKL